VGQFHHNPLDSSTNLRDRDSRRKYVYFPSDVDEQAYGKRLKEFVLNGDINYCSLEGFVQNKVELSYTFYTEGVVESRRMLRDDCFGCNVKDDYSWKFYPRWEIKEIKVENKSKQAIWCCGNSHRVFVDVVTAAAGVAGIFGVVNNCYSSCAGQCQYKYIAAELTPEETAMFQFYCNQYLYNTMFDPERVYTLEFLKKLQSDKNSIAAADWNNFMISNQTFEQFKGNPVPQGKVMNIGGLF